MDFAAEYAKLAVKAKFRYLPPKTVEASKKLVLDALGVGLAGSVTDASKKVTALVSRWGGIEESTLLYFGGQFPMINAVFANSALFHALDFDDTHDGAVVHACVTNLSAALSVSESLGKVSGEDFLLALNLGLDLTCRLGLAIGAAPDFSKHEVKYIRSAVCGGFGACIVAGKLLGLTEEELVRALGIVLSQVGGTRQVVVESAETKRLQPAFAAKMGVLSAVLAKEGILGCKEVFEGTYGYFNLYWGGRFEREVLTKDLGRHFEGVNISLKPYPCCRYTHGAIDAALECLQKHAIAIDTIKRVIVHVPKQAFFDVVSRPFTIDDNPTMDGQFSIPYTTAAALLDGYVFLDSFAPEKVSENGRKLLADKVHVVIDLPVEDRQALGPVELEIHTYSNKKYSVKVEHFKGSREKPLNWQDCIEKFGRCARHANPPLPEEQILRCIDLVKRLDELDDVTTLMEHLTHA